MHCLSPFWKYFLPPNPSDFSWLSILSGILLQLLLLLLLVLSLLASFVTVWLPLLVMFLLRQMCKYCSKPILWNTAVVTERWRSFLTTFSWFWIFSFSKFFPSPLHQVFHWNIKNMTEELHSIKNCIKWKHQPNYDGELSNCNFSQSQTSTHVEQFCKAGWYKLHQQHMSVLNTNRNIQTVLLGDSLIQGLSRTFQIYKGMEFIFRERHIKLWYTGR